MRVLKAKDLQLLKYITNITDCHNEQVSPGGKKKKPLSIAKRLFNRKENKAICWSMI